MRILIVEDDLASRHFLYKVLSNYGACDMVIDGIEALEAYLIAEKEGVGYQLICLDIMIPKVNGLQVLKAIRDFEKKRKLSAVKRVKIVMISILTDTGSIKQAKDLGIHGYLEKPLEREKLTKKMDKLNIKALN